MTFAVIPEARVTGATGEVVGGTVTAGAMVASVTGTQRSAPDDRVHWTWTPLAAVAVAPDRTHGAFDLTAAAAETGPGTAIAEKAATTASGTATSRERLVDSDRRGTSRRDIPRDVNMR